MNRIDWDFFRCEIGISKMHAFDSKGKELESKMRSLASHLQRKGMTTFRRSSSLSVKKHLRVSPVPKSLPR